MPAAQLALAIAGALALRLAVYALLARPYQGLAEAMCQFDCGWYERIALAGYGADAEWPPHGSLPHWAFFPLYPLALRAAVAVTGLAPRVAGIALSTGFFAAFMAAGAAYLRRTRRGGAAPAVFVAAAAVMPFGLFFSALYTEAAFACLCTLALLGLATARPGGGAIAAALAGATRPTGIVLAPVFAARGLLRWRREGPAALVPAAIASLGLAAFMTAQWFAVGTPFAFLDAEKLWGRTPRWPFLWLAHGLAQWDWGRLGGMMAGPSESLFAACGVAGFVAAACLMMARRWAEAWLLAGCVLAAAATGLDALPRYVACNPAFLFALHDGLARLPRPVAWIVLAALGVAGVVPLLAWMQGNGGVF
jgi:hypothetical protein